MYVCILHIIHSTNIEHELCARTDPGAGGIDKLLTSTERHSFRALIYLYC